MDERTLVNPGLDAPSAERTVAMGTGDRTVALETGDRTQMGVSLRCAVCDTQNPPGETWCAECGFRLDADPGETPAPDANRPPAQLVDAQGIAHPLRAGINAVGRQDTTILLTDSTVSRRHAQIGVEGGTIWVEDAGSSNGTIVNGQRLNAGERRAVRDGDEVRFGSLSLAVQVDPDALAALPASEAGTPEEGGEEETVETADAGGTVMGPHLLLPSGNPFPLPEGVTRVGRRSGNDLILPDSYTSGAHAHLTRDGDTVTVTDDGSTNGTLLNGDRLAPGEATPLRDGDVLVFGQTQSLFTLPDSGVSSTESTAASSETDEEETDPPSGNTDTALSDPPEAPPADTGVDLRPSDGKD